MAERYVSGFKELERKLNEIDEQTSRRVVSRATSQAVTRMVAQMRQRAPVGTVAHRTYKKRLVPPGFGRKSIRKSTKFNKRTGLVETRIGVRREAFYLIQFYDRRPGRTPYTVTSRRMKRKTLTGRQVVRVKPYTLRAVPWFSTVFINNRDMMVNKMRDILKKNIDKVVNSG